MGCFFPTALKDCQSIGLIGSGKSNLGVLSYLEDCNENISIVIREKGMFSHPRYPVRCGERYLEDITEDALVLSPSVRPDHPAIRQAKARGARIVSDAEIFFTDTAAQCFAITGSDGKSTTTALLSHLMTAACGAEVPAVGNIGQPLTPLLARPHTTYAVELSSFQLFHYAPRTERALITNVSENHLNWHTDMAEYVAAKARIYEGAKECVLSLDDPICRALLKKPPFSLYSIEKSEKEISKCKAEFAYYIKNDCVYENGRPFLPLSFFHLDGKYNLYNLLAAIAMAAGLVTEETARCIENFHGLAHRCEKIASICGVDYFDSSIDSSPSRTQATLSRFSSPVILLVGGLGKGCSPAPLLDCVKEKCRAVIGFGSFGKEAADFLYESGYQGILPPPTKKLGEAVALAMKLATPGDCVLLSPGATSFDEFENYTARGVYFRRLVKDIQT